jgi:hypothetical protein
MMKLLKTDFKSLAVALILGAFSTGFTPAATASSIYDATAELTLTLNSVTDLDGNAVAADNWFVGVEPLFPNTTMDSTGDASANASTTSSITSYVFLNLLDEVSITATSNGTASNGTATSSANVGIYSNAIANNTAQTLLFNFGYDITALTNAVGDDALATASVLISESLGGGGTIYVDILASANSLGSSLDDQSTVGSFSIELSAYNYGQLNAAISTEGSATSVVPVPAAVWLFGSGLLGLVGIARRRQVV